MLAGVLLHKIQPAIPIQLAVDLRAWGQRLVAKVQDGFFLFLHVQNPAIVEKT